MANKKKNKVVEADKTYVILYDTLGAGLSTFSFGTEVMYGGEELESYILQAAREIWDDTDSDEDDPEEDDFAYLCDQIVVLEVSKNIDVADILRKNKKIQDDEERKLYERLKKKYEKQ